MSPPHTFQTNGQADIWNFNFISAGQVWIVFFKNDNSNLADAGSQQTLLGPTGKIDVSKSTFSDKIQSCFKF